MRKCDARHTWASGDCVAQTERSIPVRWQRRSRASRIRFRRVAVRAVKCSTPGSAECDDTPAMATSILGCGRCVRVECKRLPHARRMTWCTQYDDSDALPSIIRIDGASDFVARRRTAARCGSLRCTQPKPRRGVRLAHNRVPMTSTAGANAKRIRAASSLRGCASSQARCAPAGHTARCVQQRCTSPRHAV